MLRPIWLIITFALMLSSFLGSSLLGQQQKQPPKKNDEKKQVKPAEPKKQPDPKPSAPPLPPPAEMEQPTIDTSRPTNPLDLVRGLRENDQPDLALEYLRVLENQPLPADVKSVLPLEGAITRLETAAQESDESKRDGLIRAAKGEFEQFIAANRNHPRVAEAAIALARATSIQARVMLNRALKQPAAGDKDKTAAAFARPIFDEASRKFTDAAKQLTTLLTGDAVSGSRRIFLTRELHHAQLESGINLYELARTYVRPSGTKDVSARSDSLKGAKNIFKEVASRDPNNPFYWSAKAWEAECEYAMQNIADGDKLVQSIRTEATRYPAAREGVRMVRYFEVVRKYQSARSQVELSTARNLGERWLADYRTPKPTREQFAVMYYIAFLRKEEAVATGVKTKKEGETIKIESVSANAIQQLRTAEREYRKLLEYDTDYSDRAATDRTQVIRYLIGDKPKPANQYSTFEEAHMAGLVELSEALRDEKLSPENRKKKMASAAVYLERAFAVSQPQDSPKDLIDTQVQLTYAYLQAGEPQRAAVLGEHLAKTSRNPSAAARAGVIAVQGYLGSAPPVAEGMDNDTRQAVIEADQKRAIALASDLEKTFPGEPATDAVRSMLGNLLYRSGKHLEAFQVLSRVSSEFPTLTAARLTEGAAAYQVLRADSKSTHSTAEKKQVYDRAVSDLKAITAPSAAANLLDARQYLWSRQQLVELYLLDASKGAQLAIAEVDTINKKRNSYVSIPPLAQTIHAFDFERLKLVAIVTQATPLYSLGKWNELTALLDPVLNDMSKEIQSKGTALKQAEAAKSKPENDPTLVSELATAADRLDKFRRERIVLLALQGKIRGGMADKTGDLISLMETLGGNAEANAAMLGQLLGVVRQQATGLRKEGKGDEADRLTKAVGQLFITFAGKPNLPEKHLYFAGKALNDLGVPDKAIELLAKLPEASEADLKAKFADLPDEKKNAVRTHRSAKLELAKAYRLSNQFDQADAVLKKAIGSDDKNPGWAAKVLDYRKEAIYLIEARAAENTDAKKMNELWATANRDWGKLGREYYSILVQPLPKEEEKKNEMIRVKDQIKPIYFGIIADNQRCLVRANRQILKDKPDALDKRWDSIAANMITVEKQNPELATDVREKFADILDEAAELKKKYLAAGGTMFARRADGSFTTESK